MDNKIMGLGASSGIGLGKLVILKPEASVIEEYSDNVDYELDRLSKSLEKGTLELEEIYQSKLETLGQDKAEIFRAHKMILQDPEWTKDIRNKILQNKWMAEYAVHIAAEGMASIFEKMDNVYFQERSQDIRDGARRIIRILRGEKYVDLSSIEAGTILAAEDLTPSDTAQLNPKKIVGIITATGGKTSHSAIIARTFAIPAVMGIGLDKLSELSDGAKIALDGDSGEIIINPDSQLTKMYMEKIKDIEEERETLKVLIGKPSVTLNGRHIELSANIASPNDLEAVLENDAEGIGLFRSEFLFMDRNTAPTEEEQYISYKKVLEGMGERPVIIRTMDIGGDKEVSYLNMGEEMNPFLGYRAIRYCLNEPEIFKIQIRALLRASVHGSLRIMLPMISSVKEVRKAKSIIEEMKLELKNQGFDFAHEVPIGIMIEVPSAAMISDILAKEVDFFSIGTNDLIQYTVAVDRMNPSIADLYTPYHPAVLRMIRMIIRNGHNAGIWVGMCGSVAGNLNLMPILIAMGLDEFSMSPGTILKARKRASTVDSRVVYNKLDKLLSMATAEEIEAEIKSLYPLK